MSGAFHDTVELCAVVAHMSPALNRSTALQRFKRGNTVEIRNGIIFDFYPGLPHMCSHGSHDLHLLSLQVYTDGHMTQYIVQ